MSWMEIRRVVKPLSLYRLFFVVDVDTIWRDCMIPIWEGYHSDDAKA